MSQTSGPETDPARRRPSSLLVAGLVLAAVAVLAVGAGLWWLLSDDSPAEVDLDTATEQVTSSTDGDQQASTVPEGIDGTWTVDTESGDFDFESATGSFAGYRVTEELVGIGAAEAVGRTGEVTGTVVIADGTLESTEVEVDLSSITSNEGRRDGRVRDSLDTDTFPTATFTLTESVELPAGSSEGDAVEVEAPGELTIHGVTQPVSATIEAQLVDGTAVVIGSIPVTFADYDVEVPSAPVVLSVSDEGTVEFQLLLTKG